MKYQLEVLEVKRKLRNKDKELNYTVKEHKQSNDLYELVKLVDTMIILVKKAKNIESISWTISENYKTILKGEYNKCMYKSKTTAELKITTKPKN